MSVWEEIAALQAQIDELKAGAPRPNLDRLNVQVAATNDRVTALEQTLGTPPAESITARAK